MSYAVYRRICHARWLWHEFLVHRIGLDLSSKGSANSKLLILTESGTIPDSQSYPFLFYGHTLCVRRGLRIREASNRSFEDISTKYGDQFDIVALQTNFDLDHVKLRERLQSIRHLLPSARIVYLDWFAPTDFRFAETCNPYVDAYVKKHVLKNRAEYGQPTLGDTNLSDFFNRRYGLTARQRCFPIPPGFIDKLVIGPGFITADYLLSAVLRSRFTKRVRPIDMHARFSATGSNWYGWMRREARAAAEAVECRRCVVGRRTSRRQYLRELSKSKTCFSPFGYGEVCLRDYEAILCGALLIKPDMSHIELSPDIFVPYETYVPVAWDYSDLANKVEYYRQAEEERLRITHNAYRVLKRYVIDQEFIDQMEPVLDLSMKPMRGIVSE